MKEPGKTGWHVQPLRDIWCSDKGETCPLMKESIAAAPENRRRNGLCSLLPGFLAAQHLYRTATKPCSLLQQGRDTESG